MNGISTVVGLGRGERAVFEEPITRVRALTEGEELARLLAGLQCGLELLDAMKSPYVVLRTPSCSIP